MSVEQLNADLEKFQTFMRELLGDPTYRVKLVRPPYGAWDGSWTTWAKNNHLATVRWNYATPGEDFDYVRAVVKHPQGGGVILTHPREADAAWFENNLDGLINLAGESGNKVGLFSDVYEYGQKVKTASKDKSKR